MDDIIAEQILYYRERAPEYDSTSPAITLSAEAALERLGPVEGAIELGAGTGKLTGLLAKMAGHVVAVDASPETLAINRAKHPGSGITFVAADVFAWRPDNPGLGWTASFTREDPFYWGLVTRSSEPR